VSVHVVAVAGVGMAAVRSSSKIVALVVLLFAIMVLLDSDR